MKKPYLAVGRVARLGLPARIVSLPRALSRVLAVALLTPLGVALAQPVITSTAPVANTRSAVRTSPVVVTFSQTLTAGSEGALKVYSAQRGGLRSVTTPVVRSGSTLTFTPPAARPFMPGETVFSTVTRAAAGSGGNLATAKVYQFTTAVADAGSGIFGGGSDLAVGASPSSVAIGDVNGDGYLDMLAANQGGTVSVRLNNGSGGFSGSSDVAVGATPASVAVGDVDGDGDLDLLTANFNHGTVSVRLNDGNGTFSGGTDVAVVTTPQPATPISVAVGDVDGDGDLDLLTANYYLGTVSVRLNNGSGAFSGTTDVAVGANPHSVAVGDVDGDGDLDVLTANYGANTVSVRLNNGSGTFNGGSDPAVGANPRSVAVGDVDGDGDLDGLLIAARGQNYCKLFRGRVRKS